MRDEFKSRLAGEGSCNLESVVVLASAQRQLRGGLPALQLRGGGKDRVSPGSCCSAGAAGRPVHVSGPGRRVEWGRAGSGTASL